MLSSYFHVSLFTFRGKEWWVQTEDDVKEHIGKSLSCYHNSHAHTHMYNMSIHNVYICIMCMSIIYTHTYTHVYV